MKRILIPALSALMFVGCATEPVKVPDYAVITGKLVNFQEAEVQLKYNGSSSVIADNRDIVFSKADDGSFTVKVPLTKPEYYSISRNTLYLSPGDSMIVEISQNSSEAKFEGVGAIANTYMKSRLFPKGGSLLEAGSNIRSSFSATVALVDSLATVRLNIIDTLSGVSEEFRANEHARLIADRANSYLCYPSYSRDKVFYDKEYMAAFSKDSLAPLVKRDVAQINKKEFLEVAVVRDVLNYYRDLYEDSITLIPEGVELFAASETSGRMDRELMSEELKTAVTTEMSKITNPDIITALQSKLDKAARLDVGNEAFDIKCIDAAGNEVLLSSFKGKALYIDFWATWCGPCIAESPKFHELAKKYAKHSDKLQFLAISTDTNTKSWLKFIEGKDHPIPELNSMDTKALRNNWLIKFIPRFIVIDKDFKIVSAYAPLPSSGAEITAILDSLI